MPSQATYDDVNLILRLYEMRREDKLRAAREWFTQNFRAKTVAEMNTLCPGGTAENAYFRMVTSYWEMVASFITNGVLNKELFFESGGELLVVWVRVQPFLAELRQARTNPALYGNLESVAKDYIAQMNRKAPGAYDSFAARMA